MQSSLARLVEAGFVMLPFDALPCLLLPPMSLALSFYVSDNGGRLQVTVPTLCIA